jgi:hypothetical protein
MWQAIPDFLKYCLQRFVWHIIFFFQLIKNPVIPMKKFYEIEITGAASYVYDILQKAIEILINKNATILEIDKSEAKDKNGEMAVLLTMLYRHNHNSR